MNNEILEHLSKTADASSSDIECIIDEADDEFKYFLSANTGILYKYNPKTEEMTQVTDKTRHVGKVCPEIDE